MRAVLPVVLAALLMPAAAQAKEITGLSVCGPSGCEEANVAGFGPREGVAAWAFGAAGLTAAQGVSTGVAYGVLVVAGSLPGAAVLLWRRTRG